LRFDLPSHKGLIRVSRPRGLILERNPDKSLKRVSLLAVHGLRRFLYLQTYATSYSFNSSVTAHCKEEWRKTWKKTIPPSLWFKNSLQKP